LENFCSCFQNGLLFRLHKNFYYKSALSLFINLFPLAYTHKRARSRTFRIGSLFLFLYFAMRFRCYLHIFFLFVVLFFSRVFFPRGLSFSLGRRLVRESFTYQSAPGFRQSSRTPSPKCLPSPNFARKTSRRASGTRPRPSACARCLP